MKRENREPLLSSAVLRPKTLKGIKMEYTLCDQCLLIIDTVQTDATKRKIEIPREMLGSFINELQEIERLSSE